MSDCNLVHGRETALSDDLNRGAPVFDFRLSAASHRSSIFWTRTFLFSSTFHTLSTCVVLLTVDNLALDSAADIDRLQILGPVAGKLEYAYFLAASPRAPAAASTMILQKTFAYRITTSRPTKMMRNRRRIWQRSSRKSSHTGLGLWFFYTSPPRTSFQKVGFTVRRCGEKIEDRRKSVNPR